MEPDLEQLFAEALAEEAAEEAAPQSEEHGDDAEFADEAGPEEGELTDDAENAEEESEDDAGEDDQEETEEDGEGEEASEEDEEPETEEPEEAPKDPANEIKQLVAQQQAYITYLQQQLQTQLHQQQQAAQGAVPRNPAVEQLRHAAHTLLYAADQEDAKTKLRNAGISPSVAAEAEVLLRRANERIIEGELDPGRHYAERFAGYVEQQIDHRLSQVLGPIQQEHKTKTVEELAGRYLKPGDDRQRLAEILRSQVPQGDGSPADMERRLKLALVLHRQERERKKIRSKKQKLDAKERQIQANKRAQRGSGKRARNAGNPKPRFRDDMDLAEIYEEVKRTGVTRQQVFEEDL